MEILGVMLIMVGIIAIAVVTLIISNIFDFVSQSKQTSKVVEESNLAMLGNDIKILFKKIAQLNKYTSEQEERMLEIKKIQFELSKYYTELMDVMDITLKKNNRKLRKEIVGTLRKEFIKEIKNLDK